MTGLPSSERLHSLLAYEPDTGRLSWKVTASNRASAGSDAGYLCPRSGYVFVNVDGVLYRAHRLIWVMMTGSAPPEQIDHRSGVRNDNRWSNLRPASHHQNMCNSKVRAHNQCGIKGVRRLKSGRWNARIRIDKREIGLGTFDTTDEAAAAYQRAAERLHGDFARAA